jgi:type I restriction enzyme M protein
MYFTIPRNIHLKTLERARNIRQNLENYLDGFNDVQDIISKFKLRNQLETMEEGNITFPLIEKFCTSTLNLSPKPIVDKNGVVVHEGLSNLGMGYVFEELIRKFNEENNEEAGEHFTPRDYKTNDTSNFYL